MTPEEDKIEIFKRQVSGNSMIEVVLKAHLLIEEELNLAMHRRVPYPEYLEPKNLNIAEMSFRQKVLLCGAMGYVSSYEVNALLAINKLRNGLAHRIDRTITKPDVINIATRLDPELQKALVNVKLDEVTAVEYFRWTAEIVYLQVIIVTRTEVAELPEAVRRNQRRDAVIKTALEYGVIIGQAALRYPLL